MLHKSFEVIETKALEGDGDEPGTFEAIVSVFGNVDRHGDRIHDNAFDDTLKAWRKSKDPIPVILSHDHQNAWAHVGVANPDDLRPIPGRGLYAKGVLDVDTNPLAAQVYRLMKRRSLKEFSFGYRVPEGGEKKGKDGAWDIHKIELIELGPTLSGANQNTELLAVKSDLERAVAEDRVSLADRVDAIEKHLDEVRGMLAQRLEKVESAVADPDDEPEDDEEQTTDPVPQTSDADEGKTDLDLRHEAIRQRARRYVNPYLDAA